LATANKLHEATNTAGASQLFPKLKLLQVDPIHRQALEAASAKNKHNKTTRIASARAEEVVSSQKKTHNDLNQTSSTDLLKRQATAAAVLSLFLKILVQEIAYNTNKHAATLYPHNSLATVVYFSSNEQIQKHTQTPSKLSSYSFFSLVFFLCFHLSKSQVL
jgi:hypothetical protein